MHETAEYGIAAHVIYKEGANAPKDPEIEKMTWLRQLLEAEGEADPTEFVEALKVDLFEDEVFIHAEGRGQEPLRRIDAARLRLRGPHRRRAPLRGGEGERQDRPPALHAAQRRHRRDPDLEAGAQPRATGWRWCARPGPGTRSAPSSSASAARTPSTAGADVAHDPAQGRPAAAANRRLAAARRRHPRDGVSPRPTTSTSLSARARSRRRRS